MVETGRIAALADLTDRTIVVTGGAGHIGRAASAGLVEQGAQVAVVDLDPDGCEDAAAELSGVGGGGAFAVQGEAHGSAPVTREAVPPIPLLAGRSSARSARLDLIGSGLEVTDPQREGDLYPDEAVAPPARRAATITTTRGGSEG